MKVIDILEKASVYLDLRDELDSYFNEDSVLEPSAEAQGKFAMMLTAINLILEEISVEYMPLYFKEDVNIEDGSFNLSNLTKSVRSVVGVKKGSKVCRFYVDEGYLYCDEIGTVSVRYSYTPDEVDENDDVDYLFNKLGEKTLSLGVVMEYMFLAKTFDELNMWEDRFYKSVKNALRGVGGHKTPKRRWV